MLNPLALKKRNEHFARALYFIAYSELPLFQV